MSAWMLLREIKIGIFLPKLNCWRKTVVRLVYLKGALM
jgi:hypothetical protein